MVSTPLLAANPEPPRVPPGVEWLAGVLERLGLSTAAVPWPSVWLVQLFVVGCVVFHLLERFGPRVLERDGPGPFHRGWRADLVGAVVDGPVLGGLTDVLAVSLVLLVPAVPLAWGLRGWPWSAQFALFFLANDFGRYWLHRWHHASDLLWRLHRVHHAATQMSVLTTFRFHLLEVIPRLVLLVLPFKLLGVSDGVILTYSAMNLTVNFWQHANLRTSIGWGNFLLSSPEQHWWHHSVEPRGQYANYGSTLSVWDWLFGTIYWPRGEWPDRIGVNGISHFPDTYVGRLVSIFRPDEAFTSGAAGEPRSGPP